MVSAIPFAIVAFLALGQGVLSCGCYKNDVSCATIIPYSGCWGSSCGGYGLGGLGCYGYGLGLGSYGGCGNLYGLGLGSGRCCCCPRYYCPFLRNLCKSTCCRSCVCPAITTCCQRSC